MSPEFSREHERLVAAISKAVAEHGYEDLDIAQVASYAELTPAAFERHFANKDQGVVAAQDAFLERLWLDAAGAAEATEPWPLRVSAGLGAVLDSLVEASALARAFAVEASTSLVVMERQLASLDRFAAMMRTGRRAYRWADGLPEVTERLLVGGIASIVSTHLLMEQPAKIRTLEPGLVEFLLIPYLGRAEARRSAG